MPLIATDDGIALAYEEVGRGIPLVFVHEFAGDLHSWEPQLRFFARRYRCIAYNARGYPPSAVPTAPEAYSQARARDDLAAIITALGLAPAHIIGLSMGAFAALHLGLEQPTLARSLVLAAIGYGAEPSARKRFRTEIDHAIALIRREGMAAFAASYAKSPGRLTFADHDPRGYADFAVQLATHSAEGSALTMQGVQRERPSLYALADRLQALTIPTLIIAGDEDEPTLEPSLFLKRSIPTSALLVLPKCGHTINLEYPDQFNRAVLDFITHVDAGRWSSRDPQRRGPHLLAALED